MFKYLWIVVLAAIYVRCWVLTIMDCVKVSQTPHKTKLKHFFEYISDFSFMWIAVHALVLVVLSMYLFFREVLPNG